MLETCRIEGTLKKAIDLPSNCLSTMTRTHPQSHVHHESRPSFKLNGLLEKLSMPIEVSARGLSAERDRTADLYVLEGLKAGLVNDGLTETPGRVATELQTRAHAAGWLPNSS